MGVISFDASSSSSSNSSSENDKFWMQHALKLALLAKEHQEVPVGCIIVLDNKVIGQGYNQPISLLDPTAHAEIVAIRAAAQAVNNYRLINAILYVTLEPCAMCVGAMQHARISRCVYAASDSKINTNKSNHNISYTHGILANKSADLLKSFFKARRK